MGANCTQGVLVQSDVIENRLVFEDKPSFESVEKRLQDYVNYLRLNATKLSEGKLVEKTLKALDYWSHGSSRREKIMPKLLKLNFCEVLMTVVKHAATEQEKTLKDGNIKVMRHFYLSTMMLLNYCNEKPFRERIFEIDSVAPLVWILSNKHIIENKSNEDIAERIYVCIGVLRMLIRNNPERKPYFLQAKVDKAVGRFLDDKHVLIRLYALRCMSRIIKDKDAHIIKDKGTIRFLLDLIRDALSKKDFNISRGNMTMHVTGLLEDLAYIAVNNENKTTIIDEGGLKVLVDASRKDSVVTVQRAVETIYSLSFNPTKSAVKENDDCVQELEKLKTHKDKDISKAAKGALWQLHGGDAEKTLTSTGNTGGKHIFISYSWKNKEIVRNISRLLKEHNYSVWIDIDEMEGSTLDAMAKAVENAWVVLICASSHYKESSDCRTEAEYTYKQRRPVVPVMLQRGYKMDGWLGALVGSKLYIDFSSLTLDSLEFRKAYEKLVWQIKKHHPNDKSDHGNALVPGDSSQHHQTSPAVQAQSNKTSQWTQEQVKEWITSNKLNGVLNPKLVAVLETMDGEKLVGLCWMKEHAPEYFMKHMSERYDADIMAITVLVSALNKLS